MTNLIAYLDPGAGSMFLQIAIGALFGAGFFMRQKLSLVVAWVGNLFRKAPQEPQ